jgi:hypothetical protein
MLWVALPQLALSHFGFWEAGWKPVFLGIDWKVRFVFGVLIPFAAAVTVGLRTWTPRPATPVSRVLGSRSVVPVSCFLAWLVVPAGGLAALSFLAALPIAWAPNPFVAASTRGGNGTLLLVVQTPDDPWDVFLNVRRPSDRWTRFRVAYGDPPWFGRIDLAPRTHTASISAFGVEVARFDLETESLQKIAPLTGFVAEGKLVEDPICDPSMYDDPASRLR